jgi:hypothetical protein
MAINQWWSSTIGQIKINGQNLNTIVFANDMDDFWWVRWQPLGSN